MIFTLGRSLAFFSVSNESVKFELGDKLLRVASSLEQEAFCQLGLPEEGAVDHGDVIGRSLAFPRET